MNHNEAGPDLKKRLDAANVAAAAPRLSVVWPLVSRWFATPIDGVDYATADTDLMLFSAVLDLDEPSKYVPDLPAFRLSFTRQIAIVNAFGETEEDVRVNLSVSYRPNDAFRSLAVMRDERFGVAGEDWYQAGMGERWFAGEVESSRAFLTAMQHEAFAYGVRL
jgi:hypothetical protein